MPPAKKATGKGKGKQPVATALRSSKDGANKTKANIAVKKAASEMTVSVEEDLTIKENVAVEESFPLPSNHSIHAAESSSMRTPRPRGHAVVVRKLGIAVPPSSVRTPPSRGTDALHPRFTTRAQPTTHRPIIETQLKLAHSIELVQIALTSTVSLPSQVMYARS